MGEEDLFDNVVKEFLQILQSYNNVLLVSHWDPDGIASASLVTEMLDNWGIEHDILIPAIGYYSSDAILSVLGEQKMEAMVLLDYALSTKEIENLESRLGITVLVVDHHANPLPKTPRFLNPYIYGLSSSAYPSNTWLLYKHLGMRLDLRVLLGYFGDLGPRYAEFQEWPLISKFIEEKGWKIDEVILAKDFACACYQAMNRALLRDLISKLRVVNDPRGIVVDDALLKNYRRVRQEILSALSRCSAPMLIKNGVYIYSVKSKYLISSEVCKLLADKNKGVITVVVSEVEGGPTAIYVRSYAHNLIKPMFRLKALGYNVGGKANVFSVQSPRDLNAALSDVLLALREAEKL